MTDLHTIEQHSVRHDLCHQALGEIQAYGIPYSRTLRTLLDSSIREIEGSLPPVYLPQLVDLLAFMQMCGLGGVPAPKTLRGLDELKAGSRDPALALAHAVATGPPLREETLSVLLRASHLIPSVLEALVCNGIRNGFYPVLYDWIPRRPQILGWVAKYQLRYRMERLPPELVRRLKLRQIPAAVIPLGLEEPVAYYLMVEDSRPRLTSRAILSFVSTQLAETPPQRRIETLARVFHHQIGDRQDVEYSMFPAFPFDFYRCMVEHGVPFIPIAPCNYTAVAYVIASNPALDHLFLPLVPGPVYRKAKQIYFQVYGLLSGTAQRFLREHIKFSWRLYRERLHEAGIRV